MKLADLLGVVGDSPLTQYPWSASLVTALNRGVGDHVKVDTTGTGADLIKRLLIRGSEHFLELMESDFDPVTGLLTLSEDTPVEPAPAPVVTVTAPAGTPITTVPTAENQFTLRQIVGFGAALVIVLMGLMLAISIAVTSVKNGGEISPSQERLAGKFIGALETIAKTEQANPTPAATPAPAVNDPIFGPIDASHPAYPQPVPATDPPPQ